VTPASGSHFNTGTVVSLTATPATGFVFANWTGAVANANSASTTITVNSSQTVTANFTPVQVTLTTSVSPAEAGTVTPASGSQFNTGAVVPLSATPAAGYSFTGWTGNVANAGSASTTITMSGSQTVRANFTPQATSLGGTISGKSGPANARAWTFSITNSGPGAANAAMISSFTLTQAAGTACTPVISNRLPMSVGNLAPGATQSFVVTIDFSACAFNARFTLNTGLSANGGAATGSIVRANQFQ
jgi:uncharacterized repeat protein (TIGR02543 family)